MSMVFRLGSEAEWLHCRQSVITATEAPVLLGLNPYQTPAKMLEEKENSTFSGNAYSIIGNWLEPVVVHATNYFLDTDFRVIEDETGKLFYRRHDVDLGATPDAMDASRFLECKTTKPHNYARYRFNPPEYYIMQLQTQLYCGDLEEGYLAIMSTDLTQTSEDLDLPIAIFKVLRDDKLCSILKSEVFRLRDLQSRGKMFRVNSKVKAECRLRVRMCYEKVV